ncbi:hypothetical protein [Serpentinicella alkaliphila]|uniref:Uncharacterized protein n=1 Tax=Serpentinicella alkaliphila TaxID=1734049 RepID=A0A4R2T0S3_9FIRM|nr:hypothetical protein [Serpentinicella alkaliphila]TCP96467.1 hypothetical protein EDD79_105123 [Serpentinicella alkaliphila]
MLRGKMNTVNTQKLRDIKKALKKDYITFEWQTLRGNVKSHIY